MKISKDDSLKFELFQTVSSNFLCDLIPDDWLDWNENRQIRFIEDNLYYLYEDWNSAEVISSIDSIVDSLLEIFGQQNISLNQYVLYETDAWYTKQTRSFLGIFNNVDILLDTLKIRNVVIDNFTLKEIPKQLIENKKAVFTEVNNNEFFWIEEVQVNKIENW